jgi:hypothetical protein
MADRPNLDLAIYLEQWDDLRVCWGVRYANFGHVEDRDEEFGPLTGPLGIERAVDELLRRLCDLNGVPHLPTIRLRRQATQQEAPPPF